MGKQYSLDKGFLFLKDWERSMRRLAPEKFHRLFWDLYDYQESRGEKTVTSYADELMDAISDLIVPRLIDRLNGAKGGLSTQHNGGSVGGVCSQDKISQDKISQDKIIQEEGNAPFSTVKPTKQHPPTRNEVAKYCLENNYHINVDRFYDYYESIGWKTGKNPIQDWQATVRNWMRTDDESRKKEEKRLSSFETDDFFEAAVRKSLGGA